MARLTDFFANSDSDILSRETHFRVMKRDI